MKARCKMMSEFETRVPPDLAQLGPLRRSLSGWLEGVGIADPFRSEIVLATHEATANAIEHSRAPEPVLICAHIEEGLIAIEIRDRGQWTETGVSEERGRGLPLIAALVSDVEIDARPDGTTVRLLTQTEAGSGSKGSVGAELAARDR
jgi:anti-sigma regulatory factor (Ser/Thr protein kinase)